MNGAQTRRTREEQRRHASRVMMMAFMVVFFLGLFLQIAMVVRLAGQNKRIQAMELEIRDLSATADNLNLALGHYQSLDRVATQAQKLGMELPANDQIRVVHVPDIVEDTSAQGAGNGAGK